MSWWVSHRTSGLFFPFWKGFTQDLGKMASKDRPRIKTSEASIFAEWGWQILGLRQSFLKARPLEAFMSRPRSKIAKSLKQLKQLGEIQVNDWDFMALLNKDIKEFEFAHSLRRLGQIRVTDWDFRDVVPAVKKAAQQEVDLLNVLKRTANFKVMEWDFKNRSPTVPMPKPVPQVAKFSGRAEMSEITLRLRKFLQYVVFSLIDEPDLAQIKVVPLKPTGFCFKLILTKKDTSTLIGKGGHTAAAIRGLLKAMAQGYQVVVLLQIHSHEDEILLMEKEEAVR
jgi:predicted RNA-binding protein YlqC (UPF0109 family)